MNDNEDLLSRNWNADFNYYNLHPEFLIDFEIPWKVSLSHVYSIYANINKTTDNNENYTQLQTLVLNGDVSFTKRWKLGAIINLGLS